MYSPLILPDLRMMLEDNDVQGLTEFCDALYPAVTAEVLEGLDDAAEIWRVLSNCPLRRRAEIFEYLTLARQVELVEGLDRKELSRLIEEMSPDNRVDLLERLDPDHVETLLPLMAQAERSDIRKLLSYDEDSAGSIMTTEYASLPADVTVAEALDRLRKQAPNRETIYYIYILDEGRRLRGFISLRDLILARPSTVLSNVMREDVISVRVDDDQEIVAQEMAQYDFIAIPVVDNQNRLVGIVTHDDVVDVLREEATEDTHLMAAVAPLEDGYLDTPVRIIAWKRGVWLFCLSILALVTAGVLTNYQKASEAHVWMIAFLPLVLSSGGNAGSQSATLVIRTLALGQMQGRKLTWLIRRECLVGTALGLAPATVGFFAAWLVFDRTIMQSTVVAITGFAVVILGAVVGALLPLMFERWGMDPALMSNPLIAAISDCTAVLIYYTVAITLLNGFAAT